MRAVAVARRRLVDEALAAVARAAGDGRPRARRRRLDARAVRLQRRGTARDRGRRLRRQALDPAPARRGGRGGDRLPARRRRRRARGYDGVLLSNGPGDPEPLDDEIADGRASCSAACRCSASASATSCSRSRPATRRSSSRSATAARTIRCSSARPAACSSRARTTASRSRRREDAEATHVSLYDGTVEGLELPELRARSLQFHPEAGPGPHDAWPLLETWVEEVARCRGDTTSSRSA